MGWPRTGSCTVSETSTSFGPRVIAADGGNPLASASSAERATSNTRFFQVQPGQTWWPATRMVAASWTSSMDMTAICSLV